MFLYLGSGTAIVQLGSNNSQEGPNTVVFKRADGTEFSIETRAFQTLRRGLHREQQAGQDENVFEQKISLIKALRGLTGLGLRDAKEVAEYFMNNYAIDAGSYGK